jgi:hypothetical protein
MRGISLVAWAKAKEGVSSARSSRNATLIAGALLQAVVGKLLAVDEDGDTAQQLDPVHADPLKSCPTALRMAAQKGVQRPTRRHIIVENGVNALKQREVKPEQTGKRVGDLGDLDPLGDLHVFF